MRRPPSPPVPGDRVWLVLMSLMAPMLAGVIHSWIVYFTSYRYYNCQFGGRYYFFEQHSGPVMFGPAFFELLADSGFAMVPTLPVLLLFHRGHHRRTAFVACVVLWVFVWMQLEVAFK